MPFALWPHLVARAEAWDSHQDEVVLKARQIGLSTLAQAYALHIARQGGKVLVISKTAADGKDFARKLLIILDNLPESMALPITTRNTEVIQFAAGGRIEVKAPTEHAGRSTSNTVVIIDEAAFHPYARANYNAYRPTISAGGQLLMISTAYGASGFFHDMYWDSDAGRTDYEAVFIPWHARPDRQLGNVALRIDGPSSVWLERERKAFQGMPGEFAQEYPADAGEAFVAHSGLVYGIDPDDSVLIFESGRNVRPATQTWAECKWRIGGVDPGGTDPTAILAVGVTRDERVHVYRAFAKRGPVGASTVADWLWDTEQRGAAKFNWTVCDPSQSSMVAELNQLGLAAYPANNDKAARLGLVATWLKEGRLTISESLTDLIAQFHSYWYVVRKEFGQDSGKATATRTPSSHHADLLDVLGYICLAIKAGLPPQPPEGLNARQAWGTERETGRRARQSVGAGRQQWG